MEYRNWCSALPFRSRLQQLSGQRVRWKKANDVWPSRRYFVFLTVSVWKMLSLRMASTSAIIPDLGTSKTCFMRTIAGRCEMVGMRTVKTPFKSQRLQNAK